MDTAWMLRQDGKAFPVTVHLYCMDDSDLSSEAECAAFIIATGSKDQDLAEYVLDCWLALLLENVVPYAADSSVIDKCILEVLQHLPYRFQYKLSNSKILEIHKKLNNYNDLDTLYDFVDEVQNTLGDIQSNIKFSINQQFCRTRYGGEYDTESSNNTIWFRISSIRFNWANVIYIFTSSMLNRLKIRKITICRDFESDNDGYTGASEYFYTAKDGAVYRDMPVEEFLQEEHEHSLVFSSKNIGAGVYHNMQNLLASGSTVYEINNSSTGKIIPLDLHLWQWFVRKDQSDCVYCSEFMEQAPTRTRAKLSKVIRRILDTFPEITDVDVDGEPRKNNNGNLVGMSYIFLLSSDNPDVNGLEIRVVYTKPSISEGVIFRDFKLEYLNYRAKKQERRVKSMQ